MEKKVDEMRNWKERNPVENNGRVACNGRTEKSRLTYHHILVDVAL